MAKILATNVTVTLDPGDIDRTSEWVRTFPSILFGNGSLEYSALGIPMPAIGYFGFESFIKRVYIEQPANGFIYAFDRANHKLRIFQGAAQAALTIAGATATGNVAAPGNHVNIAVPAPADHSHDLVVAANTAGAVQDAIGCNSANKLVAAANGPYTIPGGVAANGGVANGAVPAPANIANLTHNAPAFTGDSHTHVVTGGGAVAAGALVEMGASVTPAAATVNMEMVGK